MHKRELDIVVISDVHLGTYSCHSKELLNYLRSIKPKILVLNGDIIDTWQFKRKQFSKDHMEIINDIIQKSMNGTKVYYITGNREDALRQFTDISIGNIYIRDQIVLQVNHKQYWIFHGDIFDISLKISPFVHKLRGKGYGLIIKFNSFVNRIRKWFGKPRMSFTYRFRTRMKKAVKYITDFENTALKLANEQNYDYVICGHSHTPRIKKGDAGNIYMNAGDWVENLTALEYQFDCWSIYEYDELDYKFTNPKLSVKEKIKPVPSANIKRTSESF